MDLSIPAMMQRYQDEGLAWLDLEALVWPRGPVCPHCDSVDHAYFLKPQKPRVTRAGNVSYRRIYKCADCLKKFSVLKGTIFEDSKIPVSKWLLAIKLYTSAKNGISAHEMHRQLGISYESAWFMEHRLRHAVAPTTATRQLEGTVEVDETYAGGETHGTRGRGAANKTPVVTLVEREGEARSRVMRPVSGKNIRQMLTENVHPDATVMTDEFGAYISAASGYHHETVSHKRGEYSRGPVHTNTAEGFFSQLKRSLDGTFHHVSAQHLHRYVSEFDFRYSSRKETDVERVGTLVGKTRGKRLMYEQATKKR